MKLSHVATIFVGVFLIAIITPLSQFLTIMTVNADVETATPVGWAVGFVFSIVLILGVLRLFAKKQVVDKSSLVILYTMLTLAVPLMNLGLVRPFFLASFATMQEYVRSGTNTYRTAYNSLNPRWFPVVPTIEGLAWNKADRTLRLLQDNGVAKERMDAQLQLTWAVMAEAKRREDLAKGAPAAAPGENPTDLAAQVGRLGVDEINAIQALEKDDVLKAWGLTDAIAAQKTRAAEKSKAAAASLPDELSKLDEFQISQLPDVYGSFDMSTQQKLDAEVGRLSAAERDQLKERLAELAEQETALRAGVSRLSSTDFAKARNKLRDLYLAQYRQMSDKELARVRGSFVYRLTTDERNKLVMQDGRENTPNENVSAFKTGLWADLASQQSRQRQGLRASIQEIFGRLPWNVWVMPLIMWGLLFSSIFLFLMCLAEWLRRKWIERENLAFPLVDVADNIIRHDAALENAEDITAPQPRKWAVNPVFLFGFLIGFLYLSLEAFGHYGIASAVKLTYFDVSGKVFTSGVFKEMDKVFLVISPIVVGISFLVSLEVSFSIWVTFFIYKFVVLIGKLGNPEITDPIYTGWSGGRSYPFPMEQLLGATLCFSLVLLWKSLQTRTKAEASGAPVNSFIPPWLTRIGLIVLPIVILGLLWNMGITNLPFLLLIGAVMMVQTIAAARVRAETGLPAQHVSYEFTKFPIVFGLTGMTGAQVYATFINIAFLPMTLLFRTLPQHLENMELARRYKMKYGTLAAAGVVAFITAIAVGMVCFLVYSYYWGDTFQGNSPFAGQGPATTTAMATYPLWVSHFLGESGLDKFTQPHMIRLEFVAIGFAVFGLLTFLRGRFLGFPIHPIGYLLLLLSTYYEWVSPYFKGDSASGINVSDTSWLWGSVLFAWLIKKMIIKYGGMNTYKQAKPLFIGLVVGAVVCIFSWNVLDLVCSIIGTSTPDPSEFVKFFLDRAPYSPRLY